jgi:hypothetical protein
MGNENNYYNAISFHILLISLKMINFSNKIVIPRIKRNLNS